MALRTETPKSRAGPKHSWNWGHKAITGLGLRRLSAFLAPWRPKDVGLRSAERGQLPAGTVYTTGCVSGKEHVLPPHPGLRKGQRIRLAFPKPIAASRGVVPVREDWEEVGDPSPKQVKVRGPGLSPRGGLGAGGGWRGRVQLLPAGARLCELDSSVGKFLHLHLMSSWRKIPIS